MTRRSDEAFYRPAPETVEDLHLIVSPDLEVEEISVTHEARPSKRTVKAATAGKIELTERRYTAIRALYDALRREDERFHRYTPAPKLYEIVAQTVRAETDKVKATEGLFKRSPSIKTVERAIQRR